MKNHTPGPWLVVDGHYPSMQEIQGPSFKISIVMSATDLNMQDYLSRSADANLIAAAPDLLEALEIANDQMQMAYACVEDGRYDEALLHLGSMSRIRHAALAKAKGEKRD